MTDDASQTMRFAGALGLVATLALIVILVVHPFGTTDLYDDGGRFLEHVNGFWIALHVLAVVAFLAYPMLIETWSAHLATPQARLVGRWASLVATLGMAVGALHLIATDTMTFVFFEDTFNAGAGSEAVTTSADLLLRLHGATLFTWVLVFWFSVPALMAVAVVLDGRLPQWFAALAGLSAALQVAALATTTREGQWTTLSEMGLFRVGATPARGLLPPAVVGHAQRLGSKRAPQAAGGSHLASGQDTSRAPVAPSRLRTRTPKGGRAARRRWWGRSPSVDTVIRSPSNQNHTGELFGDPSRCRVVSTAVFAHPIDSAHSERRMWPLPGGSARRTGPVAHRSGTLPVGLGAAPDRLVPPATTEAPHRGGRRRLVDSDRPRPGPVHRSGDGGRLLITWGRPDHRGPLVLGGHQRGTFPCLRRGRSSCLEASIRSPAMTLARVSAGSMTSSM